MKKYLNIEVTEAMQDFIDQSPDNLAEIFLTSLLDMACIMVQFDDITLEVTGDKSFKLTAYAESGTRTSKVKLVP